MNVNDFINAMKEESARDCLRLIKCEGEPGIMDDKLGGWPYLPVGMDYPIDPEGKNMSLLWQVDLSHVNISGFPDSGILEVFFSWGREQYCKILHFEDVNAQYRTDFSEISIDRNLVSKPIKISLAEAVEYVPMSNICSEEVAFSILGDEIGEDVLLAEYFGDEGYKIIEDTFCGNSSSVNGYPHFYQWDIRGDLAEKCGTANICCILKLDHTFDDALKLNIGAINIFCPMEDIEKGIFDRAEAYWDFE